MNIIKTLTAYIFKSYKVIIFLIQGVNFQRPFSTVIRGKLIIGKRVSIGSNVTFIGNVGIADDVIIEDNCIIISSQLFKKAHIKFSSIVEDSEIGIESFIGPVARVRSNSEIGENCQIGNFVEIKNSIIGNQTRINHMAFVGDAILEANVTIGAGVITCNHDGVNVNKTFIKEGAYIGSNSNLVAPLIIGKESTIGSGSTITSDVEDNQLVLARTRQQEVEGWSGPKKRTEQK